MITKAKVSLVFGLYVCCSKTVLSNYFFTKINWNDINPDYTEVSIIQNSSLTTCGVHCYHSTSCRYFTFNTTTLSCELLGYSETPMIGLSWARWARDIYTVGTKCSGSKLYVVSVEYEKCLSIHTDISLNWHQAQDFCQRDGGSLLNINSQSEFEYFRAVCQSTLGESEFFSVGARRTGPALTDFHWVFGSSVGQKVDGRFWKTNKPDNSNNGEYCVAGRWEDDYYLNDVTCEDYYGFFICEFLI